MTHCARIVFQFRRLLTCINLLIFVLPSAIGGETSDKSESPDVVLVMLDDSGYTDFNVYGSEIDTPNIDNLAREGLRFTDCHAAAPNCSPSRAGMLTGRMPSRIGMYSYIPPKHPMHLLDEEITVAEILKGQGYATGHFGKWHLSQLEWDSSKQPQPRDQGFDHSLGTTNNSSPSHRNPNNFIRNGEAVGEIKGYSCQIVADEFISWSSKLDKNQPMLSVIWFNEPHSPIASPEHLVRKYMERNSGISKKKATYYANIENVDMAVGRILDHLSVLGRSQNCFFFLTSDNGGLNQWSNMGLRGRKSFVYEGGHREPGILKFPGRVSPGSISHEPISHLDLLPTICEITRSPLPEDRKLDGISISPLFSGKPIKRATPLFWFFYRVKPAAALRDGDWVILGYLDDPIKKHTHPLTTPDMPMIKSAEFEKFELYNLKANQRQDQDVSNSYSKKLNELSNKMKALHKEVVSDGPFWDLSKWKP